MLILFFYFSSSTHTWDAFQLAHASFRLYCVQNDHVVRVNLDKPSAELGPCILGEHLKISVDPPEADMEEDEEGATGSLPAIKIHDDDVSLRFLVCGQPSTLVSSDLTLCTNVWIVFTCKHMYVYTSGVDYTAALITSF